MKRIEPGMMCLIVGGNRPANIGRVVEVVRAIRVFGSFPEVNSFAATSGFVVTASNLTGYINKHAIFSDFAIYPPGHLMPIKGEPEKVEEEQYDMA